MSFTIRHTIMNVATGKTIHGQIVDDDGSNVGSAITTASREVGGGAYEWVHAFPDDTVGFLRLYASDAPGTILASVPISPQEFEWVDARVSSRMATFTPLTADDVDAQLSGEHGNGSWSTATGFATPADVTTAQTAILGAITALNNLSDADAAAAIMAYVLEAGKTLQTALLDMWATTVGNSTADDADNPASITYASPDGTTQVTHTLTDTTREVA